jgi:hypothetical protein
VKKRSNLCLYEHVQEKLPPFQPSHVYNHNYIIDLENEAHDNLITYSSQDLQKIINNEALNTSPVACSAAKTELVDRFEANPIYRFIPIETVVAHCNELFNFGVNLDNRPPRQRLLNTFKLNILKLDGQEFVDCFKYAFKETVDASLTRDTTINRILLNLTTYEAYRLHDNVCRALGVNPTARGDQQTPRAHLIQLIKHNFTNPALDTALRSASLARLFKRKTLWEVTDQSRENREQMARVHRDRLHRDTIQREDPNPALAAGIRMYDKLRDFVMPEESCSHCHERRYGEKLKSDGRCTRCHKSKARRNRLSPDNDMDPGDLPPELKGLYLVEKLAISLVSPLVHIVRVGNKPAKQGGNNVAFTADVEAMATVLPRLPQDLEILCFKPASRGGVLKARAAKIRAALQWLHANNNVYKEITIDETRFDAYPQEEGVVNNLRTIDIPEPEHTGNDPGPGAAVGPDDEADLTLGPDEEPEIEIIPIVGDPPLAMSHHVGAERRPLTENDLIARELYRGLGSEFEPMDLPPRNYIDGPISDFSPQFYTKAYPYLFPWGKANLTVFPERTYYVSVQEWVEHLLHYKCDRFRRNPHFLFWAHQILLKTTSWSTANLYGDQALAGISRDELLTTLRDDPQGERNLINKVTRAAKKIPGSKAHCRNEGNKGISLMRFLGVVTNQRESLNGFLTLTSLEHHDNVFLQSIKEGREHLDKKVVMSRDHIPAQEDGDPTIYITRTEDYTARMNIFTKHMPQYITFFLKKVDTFVEEVLHGAMGVREHMIRYEFQSRGGIHAHILLCLPVGLDKVDRDRAFKALDHTVQKIHDYIKSVWSTAPYATVQDLMAGPDFRQLVEHLGGAPSVAAMELAMTVIETQNRIIDVYYAAAGITESHPSNHMADRFVQHGGDLTMAPGNECLRMPYHEKVDARNIHSSCVNLVNKFGIHDCVRGAGNCQRTVQNINGEMETKCRYGFPHELVGHDIQTNADTGQAEVVADTPRVAGYVRKVTSIAGKPYNTILWDRNHRFTGSLNIDCHMIFGSSTNWQICNTEESVGQYLSKYVSKQEVQSVAARDALSEAYREAANTSVNAFVKKVLRHCALDRDYSLAEATFHLLGCRLFQFSRRIDYVNALGGVALDLGNQEGPGDEGEVGGEADPNNQMPIIPEANRHTLYDGRLANPTFQALVQEYEAAPEHEKPFDKHPHHFNFWDYVAYFKQDWAPRDTYFVPHFVPHFSSRPSGGDYLFKFLVCMHRCYNCEAPPLAQLLTMSEEELTDLGNQFFTHDQDKCPKFAVELWQSNEADYLLRQEAFDHTEGDLFPSPNRDNERPDDDGIFNEEDAFYEILNPGDHANDQLENDLDAEVVTADFDYAEDRRNIVPHWDVNTPKAKQLQALNNPPDIPDVEPEVGFDQLNSDQQKAVTWLMMKSEAYLNDNSKQFCVEVCGPAGSGKTTTMKVFKQLLRPLVNNIDNLSIGEALVFAAPTGCAAKLLPTSNYTLHKLLQLPRKSSKKKECPPLSDSALRNLQELLRHLKILVIDEKSFIGCYYIHTLNSRLKQIFPTSGREFGGISIVLMGDFAQLAPVMDRALYLNLSHATWTGPQVKGYNAYVESFTDVLCLKSSVRQGQDPEFKALLEHMQNGPLNPADLGRLGLRDLSMVGNRSDFDDSTMLCAKKTDYQAHNRRMIAKLDAPKVMVTAVNEPEIGKNCLASDAGGLENTIVLARDMRVMLTANLDLPNGLTNGTIGYVRGIIYFNDDREVHDDEIPTVLVHFPEYNGPSCLDDSQHIYPVCAIKRNWQVGKENYSRLMVPLAPAYGMTIHKSQGQTLGKVVINLGSNEFATGLTYTALSRVRRFRDFAFSPMPDVRRLNAYSQRADFDQIKHDRVDKEAAALVTLQQLDHQG